MDTWYRVFGAGEDEPAPAAILEHLQGTGAAVTGKFGGDDAGWFYAELVIDGHTPLRIDRYRSDEKGIRAELNSWAAWAESLDAGAALMERFIQSRQLFTFRAPDEQTGAVCLVLARFLARATGGLYQIDGRGLFTAEDVLLLAD